MGHMQMVTIEFGCEPENESFARVAVAAFAARLNPTIEEMADIKTAVSEAVTNSIIHGYYIEDCEEASECKGIIRVVCCIHNEILEVSVIDKGVGIKNIKKAMEPMYTTRPELERSGMGFAFMEAFMDEVTVDSTPGIGTTVKMTKKIANAEKQDENIGLAVGYD